LPSLWRKSLRDLGKARWQAIGLALLVAVVVTLMAGAGRARGMLAASRADVLERLAIAHLDVRASPTHPGVSTEAGAIDGVADVEERMLFQGVLRGEGIPSTPALVRLLPGGGKPRINAIEVLDGRWPEDGEEAVLVDRSARRHRGIEIGDRIEVDVRGERHTFPVVGVTLDGEHALTPAHPDFEIPIPGAWAVIHLSAAAGAHYTYADRVDSLLFRFEDGADRDAVEARIRQVLPVAINAVVRDESNPGQRMSGMVLHIFDIYMPTVAAVLIAVALALFVMTIMRIVRRQRPQIGTLLAIGHRPVPIALSLLTLSVVPTILGGLLGALAHPIVGRRIFDAHVHSVGWPPLVDPGPGPEGAVTLLACAGVAIVACFVPALLAARRMPQPLLRHGAWDVARTGVLVGLATKLRDLLGLPLSVVLGLTTVLRRRWATATAAIALAANFAIVLAFLFVHISHSEEVQATFDRLGLDGTAYFDAPQVEAGIRAQAPPEWTRLEPLITRIAWMDFPTGPDFMRLTCLEADSWIRKFPLARGRAFSGPAAAEMHVDHWVAKERGLDVGSRLRVHPFFTSPEGQEVEVVGILDGVSMGLIVMPLETGRRLYELPGMCTGIHIGSAQSRADLLAAMRALPDVESVVYLDDARDHVGTAFSAAQFIVSLALALAVIVGVIFLGILASLDATERTRDLAVLSSLGWRDRSVVGLCVTEVASRGYLALLLSLPAAPLLGRWILTRIEEANNYRMPLHDPAWVYVTVVVLGAVLIPLGAFPAWRAASALPPGRVARLLARE
jgi:putative ABC transport system permease protein